MSHTLSATVTALVAALGAYLVVAAMLTTAWLAVPGIMCLAAARMLNAQRQHERAAVRRQQMRVAR